MHFEKGFFNHLPEHHINFEKMPAPDGVKLHWDGAHVGEIDKYVISYKKVEYDDTIYLWSKTSKKLELIQVRIFKYKDDVSLIADDIKKIFGIPQVGKHRALYKNNECIIVRFIGDESYEKYFYRYRREHLSPGFIKEMQRLFLFRYLICLNCNFENCVEIRTGNGSHYPVSFKENTFSLFPDDPASRIPKNIVKEWFDNDDEKVLEIGKEMLDGIDIMMLKFKIADAMMKYTNGKHIGWVNAIYDRLITLSNL